MLNQDIPVKRSRGFGQSPGPNRDPANPAAVRALLQQGVQHLQTGGLAEAARQFERVLALQPHQPEALHFLGIVYMRSGHPDQAVARFRQALVHRPDWAELHSNLGLALMAQECCAEAAIHFREAVTGKPELIPAWHCLARLQIRAGELQEALRSLQVVVARQPNFPGACTDLGCVLRRLHRLEEALEALQRAAVFQPADPDTLVNLGIVLYELGRTDEAISCYRRCAELHPDNGVARWRSLLTLPILYEHPEEIGQWRECFREGLDTLIATTDLTDPAQRRSALAAAAQHCNFYLQYQCEDDTALQAQYGTFLHRLMAAAYPQWCVTDRPSGEKIRVGYLSAHLYEHNGGQWALGWLQHHDRNQFELYCYHVGSTQDAVTERFRQLSDHFHHFPDALEAAARQVHSDCLHVLVFTDLGMSPLATQLAALRLAPVQCTAWGHPVTSGLPTIDYYLSSEAMEPEDGDSHYTEQLVRLPRLGLCFERRSLAPAPQSRADFLLPEGKILYLSSQSLYKYLPQYDGVYPRIAAQVPGAHFAFIVHASTGITEQFRQRLRRAFAAVGLESDQYVTLIPRLNVSGFREMHRVVDVCLDTIGWSGGNTSLEALACQRPVVTLPGRFMRGRHTCAMLQVIGVTEMIASDLDNYVEIAVRLGLDSEWRAEISQRIAAGCDRLFEDSACVAALDAFYREVAAHACSATPVTLDRLR
jgi:predicted O-linked N-acetylglucosamine transferase (SPINDLY family)